MKKLVYFLSPFLILFIVSLPSCKKTDVFPSDQLNDYMQLTAGKYIRYRLDSTLYVNFGQKDTTISYEAKDVVDTLITDNLGRISYRVIRYLRDTSSTSETDWKSTLTYMVTPSRESIEVIEDNLRYQKLRLPVTDGFNWHGNAFLPNSPFYSLYQFSNDQDIQVWDYTYQDIGQPAIVGSQVYDNTITVQQVADSVNVPITFPEGLANKSYWVEQYAKNIGLIYKEVIMWEYQPPNGGNPGYITGFGLKMSIIDHN